MGVEVNKQSEMQKRLALISMTESAEELTELLLQTHRAVFELTQALNIYVDSLVEEDESLRSILGRPSGTCEVCLNEECEKNHD